MSTPESEIESNLESSNSSIGDSSTTCWECMADYLYRVWECICNSYLIAQDWILDVLCCTCSTCCGTGEEAPQFTARNAPRINTSQIQPSQSQMMLSTQTKQSPPKISMASYNSPDSPPQGRSIFQAPPSNQPSVSATIRSSISPPPMSNSNASRNVEVAKETPPFRAFEPPRIDFVETGSIFGDRKRLGSENNLQMENGRFRSPGMSKTIVGPNGRSIRVSFVTGFPAVKSVESTRSVISKNYRKSTETIQSQQQPIQRQQERGSQEKMRKVLSNKSFKSYKSLTSVTDNDNPGKTLELKIDDISNK